MSTTKSITTASNTVAVLIILGIVIAANVIVSQFRGMRGDLTEEKLYTLSDGTKDLVKDLERDVTLKFFYSKTAEGLPIQLKQYAQRIIDLLKEYEAHSGKRVVVELLNPTPDSDEEEWARKYGLTPQGLPMLGGEELYLGLVASSGKNEAAIPFIAPNVEPQLEYLVTRLVHEVTLDERPKLGLISSLPVMGGPQLPPQMSQGRPPSQPWYFTEALRSQWEIEDLGATATEIADDIRTVLLIQPKNLSDDTLYALDQFVLRGGRLFAFVDPMCYIETRVMPQQNQFGFMNANSDLNKLTESWGAALSVGQVVGDFGNKTQQGFQPSPVMPTFRADAINRDEVATSSLKMLTMLFPGSLTTKSVEGVNLTKLITTSVEAGEINSFQAMGDPQQLQQELKPSGEKTVAVRMNGTFKTNFPDKDGDGHLAESTEDGVVILIADVDMIADQIGVRMLNFLGSRMAQPLNDNLTFLENMVEQLNGSDALIGLRSRGTYERPFDKVQDMQAAAQKQFQAEATKLQEKVREAQKRINELQADKSADQKFIFSKEQKDELKKLREEEFAASKKLKEVRKELRKDVDNLGTRLKVLNIAAVPAIIAIFGIARGLRRRGMSSAA